MPAADPALPILYVDRLTVEFATSDRVVTAVKALSFQVGRGETVAVVGESGSGKSVSALSIMRLVEHGGGRIVGGRIGFARPRGATLDLATADGPTLRGIRGAEIAMIFQEPMTSLNPVFTVGDQISESIRLHQGKSRAAATAEALAMLEQVRIPEARRMLDRFPHQLSGGMRQRLMIAMALSCKPALLIADEPTTALDVTIQAQILELMRELSRRLRIAMLIITHNLGVVARYADRVNVMYAGRIIEQASAAELYANPRHPYTLGLLRSVPRLDEPRRARLEPIDGQPPDLSRLPPGCAFAPRCTFRAERCAQVPPLHDIGLKHASACWESEALR